MPSVLFAAAGHTSSHLSGNCQAVSGCTNGLWLGLDLGFKLQFGSGAGMDVGFGFKLEFGSQPEFVMANRETK